MRNSLAAGLVLLMGTATVGRADVASFDHSTFDALLKKHVVDGMVDYDAFARAPEFPAYLASLEKADLATLDEKERLAFWINAYNAYTIHLINSHKERDSIRNINKTLGVKAHGPWREKLVKAARQVNHLDNVEHDIIRKQFKEPRIHYALVCAAMGCPPLRSEAYSGAKLDDQLADQAKVFVVGSPQKNRVDVAKGIFYASPVMSKYYREDFGNTDAAIARYHAQFFPQGPEKTALLSGTLKVVATDYDWTLNSQEKARLQKK